MHTILRSLCSRSEVHGPNPMPYSVLSKWKYYAGMLSRLNVMEPTNLSIEEVVQVDFRSRTFIHYMISTQPITYLLRTLNWK